MNTNSKAGAKASLYLITLVLLAGFVFLLMTDMHNKEIEANGVSTQATVIQITSVRHKKGVSSKNGIAEYFDEQGGRHLYEGFLGNDEIDVGKQINIIYDKDNPDTVIRENPYLTIFVVAAGVLGALCLWGCFMITFRSFDRLSVKCMQQPVSDEELERIVREYMPQTRDQFLKKRAKNKGVDKLRDDAILHNQIRSGDPIGLLYDRQQEVREIGELHLCAVIRPTDQNIYSEQMSFSDDNAAVANGRWAVPAFVVYGADDYFEHHPAELKTAASRLAGDVWGGRFSDQDMRVIDELRNPSYRPFQVSYCGELTMGHPVYYTTVILVKSQLCNNKLSNKLLYLLSSPQRSQGALVLPAWYYSMWELSAF